jgi:hypothetical protein
MVSGQGGRRAPESISRVPSTRNLQDRIGDGADPDVTASMVSERSHYKHLRDRWLLKMHQNGAFLAANAAPRSTG